MTNVLKNFRNVHDNLILDYDSANETQASFDDFQWMANKFCQLTRTDFEQITEHLQQPIEVEKLTQLKNSLNFVDTHRHFIDENEKLYSWWSYRAVDPLGANKGRRLDHIWATPNLKKHIHSAEIYREFRAEIQPSDHVPIQTNFNFS